VAVQTPPSGRTPLVLAKAAFLGIFFPDHGHVNFTVSACRVQWKRRLLPAFLQSFLRTNSEVDNKSVLPQECAPYFHGASCELTAKHLSEHRWGESVSPPPKNVYSPARPLCCRTRSTSSCSASRNPFLCSFLPFFEWNVPVSIFSLIVGTNGFPVDFFVFKKYLGIHAGPRQAIEFPPPLQQSRKTPPLTKIV